ncbi:hypothetical protein TIFTF001_029799 [Ficus carica]|uniref:Uncharacterized protein n=1 Tax=Ficus carica TaxID=3494 RepID=A0AA88J3V1_FICCA|nr:hypothetical protein TIFTF001_029799 [Ficus carica]
MGVAGGRGWGQGWVTGVRREKVADDGEDFGWEG